MKVVSSFLAIEGKENSVETAVQHLSCSQHVQQQLHTAQVLLLLSPLLQMFLFSLTLLFCTDQLLEGGVFSEFAPSSHLNKENLKTEMHVLPRPFVV